MDGGSVLSIRLRVQVRHGKTMRSVFSFDEDNKPSSQVPWPYGRNRIDAVRIFINSVPWVLIPGIPVGLPVAILKNTAWDQDLVDIEKLIDDQWVEIDERDWRELNAKGA